MSAEPMPDAVQRLVDRAEITDLVHRYSFLIDTRRYDEVVALFTEDCVTDYGPGVGGERHGRVTLRSMFGTRFEATSHNNANVLITFEGPDRASLVTSVYAWHESLDGSNPRIWGYYFDVVVRTPEGWRIAERRLRVAGCEAIDTVWHPLLDPS